MEQGPESLLQQVQKFMAQQQQQQQQQQEPAPVSMSGLPNQLQHSAPSTAPQAAAAAGQYREQYNQQPEQYNMHHPAGDLTLEELYDDGHNTYMQAATAAAAVHEQYGGQQQLPMDTTHGRKQGHLPSATPSSIQAHNNVKALRKMIATGNAGYGYQGMHGTTAAAAAAAAEEASRQKRHKSGASMLRMLAAEASAYDTAAAAAAGGGGGGGVPKPQGPAQHRGNSTGYRGVRLRPWGKYATEIRDNVTRSRIWLGEWPWAD
jgi:hypothetical protein